MDPSSVAINITRDQRATAEAHARANARAVLTALPPFARRVSGDKRQAEILERIASELETRLLGIWPSALTAPYHSFQMPMLIYQSLSADAQGAVAPGLGALCYGIGVNLLDDVLDGDRPRLGEMDNRDALLLGVTSVAALAPVAFLEAPAKPGTQVRALRALNRGSLLAAGGQSLEMRSQPAVSPATAVRIAELKTGHGVAGLCRAGAILAGAPAATVDLLGRFAFHLATARQLFSDIGDLDNSDLGKDLRAGTVTHTTALLLRRGTSSQRANVRALLERAKADREARSELLELARTTGARTAALGLASRYRDHAAIALAQYAGRAGPLATLTALTCTTGGYNYQALPPSTKACSVTA